MYKWVIWYSQEISQDYPCKNPAQVGLNLVRTQTYENKGKYFPCGKAYFIWPQLSVIVWNYMPLIQVLLATLIYEMVTAYDRKHSWQM